MHLNKMSLKLQQQTKQFLILLPSQESNEFADREINKSDLRQSYLKQFKSPSIPKMEGSGVMYD